MFQMFLDALDGFEVRHLLRDGLLLFPTVHVDALVLSKYSWAGKQVPVDANHIRMVDLVNTNHFYTASSCKDVILKCGVDFLWLDSAVFSRTSDIGLVSPPFLGWISRVLARSHPHLFLFSVWVSKFESNKGSSYQFVSEKHAWGDAHSAEGRTHFVLCWGFRTIGVRLSMTVHSNDIATSSLCYTDTVQSKLPPPVSSCQDNQFPGVE